MKGEEPTTNPFGSTRRTVDVTTLRDRDGRLRCAECGTYADTSSGTPLHWHTARPECGSQVTSRPAWERRRRRA